MAARLHLGPRVRPDRPGRLTRCASSAAIRPAAAFLLDPVFSASRVAATGDSPSTSCSPTPPASSLRTDLLHRGRNDWSDALFQRCGRREPGYSRPFVLAADVHDRAHGQNDLDRDRVNPTRNGSLADHVVHRSRDTFPRRAPDPRSSSPGGEGQRRRFLVRYRLGGREATVEHAGSFTRKSDAVLRRNFVISLLAAGQGDEIRQRLRSTSAANGAITVAAAAERWKASRVDVAAGTAQTYRVALDRILPASGISHSRTLTSPPSPTSWPTCRR